MESTSRHTQAKDSNTMVRLINPNNSGYRKVACGANGEHILVYLDTGSEFNIITLACVQRMQVSGIRPSTTVLWGFGGGSVSGVGEITLGITIDGVALNVDAFVVECGLSDVDLLLGQPALNGDIVLVV